MALAMKTACCGRPLRSVCISLLHVSLILYSLKMLYGLWKLYDPQFSKIFENVSIPEMDVFLLLLGCVLFMSTIVIADKDKYLFIIVITATVTFLLIHSAYTIYTLIAFCIRGTLKNVCYFLLGQNSSQDKNECVLESTYYLIKIILAFVYAILLVEVVFRLYLALVLRSFIKHMQREPVDAASYASPQRTESSVMISLQSQYRSPEHFSLRTLDNAHVHSQCEISHL